MPAKSKDQREAIAIAEHHPDQLYSRNAGLLKMTHQQMHDFAATPEEGLPKRVKKPKASRNSEVYAYDWKKHQGNPNRSTR